MENKYKVGIIGCGRPHGTDGSTGYGMSHEHWMGLKKTGKCELTAVADINEENAKAFVKDHNPDAKVYLDYMDMMKKEGLDIVCIALWPHLHSKVTCDVAAFKPKAIHCEKPMDIHWDASLKMHQVCKDNNIQLTINHQRRFTKPFMKVKSLIDEGAIGEMKRMEAAWDNFFDAGTHWFDMLFYLNNETPAEWVMGQVDMRKGPRHFGALMAGQGICTFKFKNGVRATYFSGKEHEDLGCMVRVIGSEGIIEVVNDMPALRLYQYSKPGFEDIETGESIHEDKSLARSIKNLVDCLENKETPILSADHAIQSTEVIFATYESSKRRARVDLPLPPGPSALLDMVESGDLVPDKKV